MDRPQCRPRRRGCRSAREGPGDEGFNAQTGQYENLVDAGVIDPVKVVRLALQNAASVASLLLATEAAVSQLPAVNADRSLPEDGEGVY